MSSVSGPFVMQGGEGTYPVGKIADIVKSVKERYSDCAVTPLTRRVYTGGKYEIMRDAGADRYLLRHETADRNTTGSCIRPSCPGKQDAVPL